MSDSINFGTLNRDGTVTNRRSITRSTIMACPHLILVPEHYRDDGTCRCDEEREQRLAKRRKPILTAYTHDNRWSPGGSGVELPEGSSAMYSARWIDQGDTIPADVVPDRQGFAYNDTADRDRLIDAMIAAGDSLRTPEKVNLWHDRTTVVMNTSGSAQTPAWKMFQRRAGGYIYVDAWLTP